MSRHIIMELVILYLLLALIVSFLCSVLEAVLLSTPVSFITMKQQQGAANAASLMRLKQDIDRPISAILSLNTIAHTVGSAGVGAEAVKVFGETYFGIISALLTLIILVFSEIIPKTIGSYYWRQLAMSIVPLLRCLIFIMSPLVWLSEWITKWVASKKQSLSVSREEVSAMVSVGAREGVFEHEETTIIENLFKLGNITVGAIMTPRTVTITTSEQTRLKDFYAQQAHRAYSRIPVYRENPDFITGYILKQNVLEELADDHFSKLVCEIRRPILAYDEKRSVADVWEDMLRKKEHIAQVQNSFGCFLGIVTMEDLIETIIGQEIIDENDTVEDMQAYALEEWKRHKKKETSIKE